MPKNPHGCRSKYSLLPFQTRYLIASMLHDGATCQAVVNHPEVKSALEQLGTTITISSVSKIKKCKEYRDFVEQRTKMQQYYSESRLSAAMLQDCDATSAISEQLKIDLLKLVKECASANPDDPKEVERLVRSAIHLSNPAKDSKIDQLKLKLTALQSENELLQSRLAQQEKSHQEELEQVRQGMAQTADPAKVADQLSVILGLNREESDK